MHKTEFIPQYFKKEKRCSQLIWPNCPTMKADSCYDILCWVGVVFVWCMCGCIPCGDIPVYVEAEQGQQMAFSHTAVGPTLLLWHKVSLFAILAALAELRALWTQLRMLNSVGS